MYPYNPGTYISKFNSSMKLVHFIGLGFTYYIDGWSRLNPIQYQIRDIRTDAMTAWQNVRLNYCLNYGAVSNHAIFFDYRSIQLQFVVD